MRTITERRSFLRDDRGFTLIELMVVIVIIGILATIVTQKIITKPDEARVQTARAQISILGGALDQYALDTGNYPTTSDGLQALVRDSGAEGWNGPYLTKKEVPSDPWGNPYVYQSPGANGDYDLLSYGKDGQQGGEGVNADIASWE